MGMKKFGGGFGSTLFIWIRFPIVV